MRKKLSLVAVLGMTLFSLNVYGQSSSCCCTDCICPPGPQGAVGPQGNTGIQGNAGIQGVAGLSGLSRASRSYRTSRGCRASRTLL